MDKNEIRICAGRTFYRILGLRFLVGGAAIALSIAAAAAGNAPIPPNLGAKFWQWANAIPAPSNPLLDTTGAHCAVNQDDDQWFLAGTFNGAPTASRTCKVPSKVRIAFPIGNYIAFDTPYVCGQGAPYLLSDLRTAAAGAYAALSNAYATLDGTKVANVAHLVSPVFSIYVPANNIWLPLCPVTDPLTAGRYRPAVDDGLYAVLAPLPRGGHTLRIHAEFPTFVPPQTLDVTYYLNVVDE